MATSDLTTECSLVAPGVLIAGVDEVGRGAIAGPVCVGVVVIDAHAAGPVPTGLTDSKLLSRSRREELVTEIQQWCVASEVGWAAATEIDAIGIVGALRRAAERALAALPPVHHVLLDGSHNWLRRPAPTLLSLPSEFPDPDATHDECVSAVAVPISTKVKADVSCASVAAGSVLAKVARDAYMRAASAHHPQFLWEQNKGYSSPEHRTALQHSGACDEHRRSWELGLEAR